MVIQTNLHLNKGFVWGDAPTIWRNYTIAPGITVAKAYLTIKTNQTDADPGLIQKSITSANVIGTGQITDTGAGGTATVRFDLGIADTQATPKDTPIYFSIRLIYSDGRPDTPEDGLTSFSSSTTGATT